MAKPTGLARRKGIYYFRIRVPSLADDAEYPSVTEWHKTKHWGAVK